MFIKSNILLIKFGFSIDLKPNFKTLENLLIFEEEYFQEQNIHSYKYFSKILELKYLIHLQIKMLLLVLSSFSMIAT